MRKGAKRSKRWLIPLVFVPLTLSSTYQKACHLTFRVFEIDADYFTGYVTCRSVANEVSSVHVMNISSISKYTGLLLGRQSSSEHLSIAMRHVRKRLGNLSQAPNGHVNPKSFGLTFSVHNRQCQNNKSIRTPDKIKQLFARLADIKRTYFLLTTNHFFIKAQFGKANTLPTPFCSHVADNSFN